MQKIIKPDDLKKIRLAADKSPARVAMYLGIKSRKTIINWEAGRSEPEMNQFIVLSQKLGFYPHMIIAMCVERAKTGKPLDLNKAQITD